MEPFRPIIADSVVISAINNGEVRGTDFIISPVGCAIRPAARKRLIGAYERRMAHTITHPVFSYSVSYRRTLEVQARLFGRHLLGEIESYPEAAHAVTTSWHATDTLSAMTSATTVGAPKSATSAWATEPASSTVFFKPTYRAPSVC